MRGGAESGKDENKIDGVCIGIDLGTTYSCVAVWKNGRVEICPNEQGNRITPSYVAWSADGTRLVGDAAKNQAAQNPPNTVFDVKRLIGRKFLTHLSRKIQITSLQDGDGDGRQACGRCGCWIWSEEKNMLLRRLVVLCCAR